MVLWRTSALCVLLVFLGLLQHVSPSAGARSRGAGVTASPAPGRAPAAPKSGSKSAARARGALYVHEDNMRCTWAAGDVADTVRLTVKCENPQARVEGGVTDLQCRYDGKPQQCRRYRSNPRGFWRQVGRAFKKLQGKVCRDDGALLRAGMCKHAPRDAHFKLDPRSAVASSAQDGQAEVSRRRPPPPPSSITAGGSAAPTNCTGRVDVRQRAEEHCGGSWASLCALLFSVLQSDEC